MDKLESPAYVVEESLLRQNLTLIKDVATHADVEIILAFKAFALWKTFPIIRSYISYSTASSLYEARLSFEEMGAKAHTFSPAYTKTNIDEFIALSSHITLNSLSQYELFKDKILRGTDVSWGIRINPQYSPVETELYNPCGRGSRFGVNREELGEHLPEGVKGIHFHVLCEGSAEDLENTLRIVERNFSQHLDEAQWLNMGGGHLMTHQNYDVEYLIKILRDFKQRHPNLHLILEPGSAFAWQTGYLLSTVVDIVKHDGIQTAILDVSFTCHMPDCLEMPYQPAIRGAKKVSEIEGSIDDKLVYRMGGNSCLSGDFCGDWLFESPLTIGDTIIFEDMIHYTTVKTNMFNGIHHPSLVIHKLDGGYEVLRSFDYNDYKNRMD